MGVKKLICVIAAAFVATASYGQLAAVRSAVSFDKRSVNFTRIEEANGPVSAIFSFTNEGIDPYVIDYIRTSCGCTVPEYSKRPVMKGEKGEIKITFNPEDRPGAFRKEIFISANNRKYIDTLTITGTVIARPRTVAELFPIELQDGLRSNSTSVLMGTVARDESCYGTIGLINNSKKEITVGVNFLKTAATYKSVYVTPSVLPPGSEGEIVVEYDFNATNIWGMVSDPFDVVINGKKWRYPFSATATVVEGFGNLTPEEMQNGPTGKLSASYFHFGNVAKGKILTKTFELTNTGNKDLIIRHIQATGDNINYTVSPTTIIKKGEKTTISVNLFAGQDTGRTTGSIMLILNSPLTPILEIKLAATVQ